MLDSYPNAKNENIFKTTLSYIISYILSTVTYSIKDKIEYIRALANALVTYIYTRAYYLWSNRVLLYTQGITYRAGMAEGKTAILVVVYIVVAFLVATILFPIAMTQVTSANTTSWNAAVSTTYVVLLPVLVIIALALHFLGLF